MTGQARAYEATRKDLEAERASGLSRATERLEAALKELSARDASCASAPTRAAKELRREALTQARERLWYLVIHREALGLYRHEIVYEVLGVPREVRVAMGPRRAR